MIRELLDAHGLTKCTVKAIVFAPCCSPSVEMIQRMPQRDVEKTAVEYYYQEYKIACPNIDYVTVMKFIREADYNSVRSRDVTAMTTCARMNSRGFICGLIIERRRSQLDISLCPIINQLIVT